MAELPEESQHVWSAKSRIVLFLSAMRHFADTLSARGYATRYLCLGKRRFSNFAEALRDEIQSNRPIGLVIVEPGDHRVLMQLRNAAEEANLPMDVAQTGIS